jgi:hypothetical protein
MRHLRAFRPACTGLEGRFVLSGSGATAAVVASAGDAASNQAALSAFAEEAQQGPSPTPSRNNPHNWGLVFTKAAQSGIPDAPSDPPVGGVLSAVSKVSIKNTGGLLDINTPQGQVELGVHGPADTALPFAELLSPVALTDKVHGGTGAFQGIKGSGTVDVELTPTGQSTEGTVTQGVLTPSDAEGTLTFTFNPGT